MNFVQEIQEAWETLSDANERSWYDSHREEILRGVSVGQTDHDPDRDTDFGINLWPFFSSDAFDGFEDGVFSAHHTHTHTHTHTDKHSELC